MQRRPSSDGLSSLQYHRTARSGLHDLPADLPLLDRTLSTGRFRRALLRCGHPCASRLLCHRVMPPLAFCFRILPGGETHRIHSSLAELNRTQACAPKSSGETRANSSRAWVVRLIMAPTHRLHALPCLGRGRGVLRHRRRPRHARAPALARGRVVGAAAARPRGRRRLPPVPNVARLADLLALFSAAR